MNYKALQPEFVAECLAPERFPTAPRHHQGVSILWALDRQAADRRVAYWHDVGTGKSLAALYTHRAWGTRRLLVVCPNPVVDNWAGQLRAHAPGSPFLLLRGPTQGRRDWLTCHNQPMTYVLNYEGARLAFSGDAGGRPAPDKAIIQAARLDGLIVDECHHVADPTTQQSKVLAVLSAAVPHVVIMTATPYKRSMADLWGQYYALDQGRTLGPNRWTFLRKYFERDRWGGWYIKGQLDEEKLARRARKRKLLPDEAYALARATTQRQEAEATILSLVSRCTLRYDRDECFDLPPRSYAEYTCEPTAEQRRMWAEIAGGLDVTADDAAFTAVQAQAVAHKISQVAGGFYMEGGVGHRLKANPKLDLLEEVLADIPGKVIVFHHYVEEGRMICERLGRMRLGHAALRGEVRDGPGEVRRFQEDPGCRVLVAQAQSGGEGLNLQVATTVLFYSSGTSVATVREQAEGRVYRLGQERPVLIGDLLLTGSLDEARLYKARDARGQAAAVLAWVRDSLK